jgi:hypothetical protein
MVSVVSTGGTVTNFSPRFSLSDMTGTFPPKVLQGANAVSGTSGPAHRRIFARQAVVPDAAGGSFAIPWIQQTGPFRYAPMQKYPGTKITAQTKTPLNPTSPYTVATTYLPTPTVISTVTMPITWTFSQVEHTVCLTRERVELFIANLQVDSGGSQSLRRYGKVFESVERLKLTTM